MTKVYIGTSGYSYKDWVGPVYPPGTRQQDYLDHYCREFNMVELNFSYYRQPEKNMLQRMVDRTGPDFLFCIKAHKSLTHEAGDNLQQDIDKYKDGITPLLDAGKLGAVLFQFPYSFHYTPANRKYLDFLLQSFTGVPSVVEFRNSKWQQASVLQGLAERDVGMVNVDEPELQNLLKPGSDVTSIIGYIRFHGRNKTNWWQGDNTSRYDYLYSAAELNEWLPRILDIIKTAKLLLVAFNNHYKGQAVENARQLKALLAAEGIDTH